MTSLKFIGAALVASAFIAAPASAQQAIEEPGAFAFYHPNADVLNAGSSRPADAMASTLRGGVASAQMSVRTHKVNRGSIKRN